MIVSASAHALPRRPAAWIAPLAGLLLALALLLPGIAGFPYPEAQAQFSDLTISHFPYAVAVRGALLDGRVPLWSPGILSGAPLAANPLAGLWYPPGWLALLLPLPLGFNLLTALHLAWGGWGLYLVLRREGLQEGAALFGLAAWVLLPKLYAHYGAGHLTLLYAVPWTPWLLLAARRRQGWWAAVILALIFTADPRWSAYAGVVWLGYSLADPQRPALGVALRRLAVQGLLAGLLAAPLALPMLEYARLSTRAALTPQDVLAYSLPPTRVLGLLYPDLGGFHEFTLYAGQAVLALALLAGLGIRRGPATRFWGWAALLALLWALGEFLPGTAWLARLPGLDLLRVPSRALFVAGLALMGLAAHAVQALLAAAPLAGSVRRRARLALAGLAGLSLALTLGVALVSGTLPRNFAWGSTFMLLAAAWIGLRLSEHWGPRLTPHVWLGGLALLALLDLGGMDRTLFASRPAAEALAEGAPAAAYLAKRAQTEPLRVYSPSYSLPQQTAAGYGLELADGVDPLQLAAYAEFMQAATGVPASGYSVTLPPFAAAPAADGEAAVIDVATANAAYAPDAERLGWLNVAYVAAEFDLHAPGLILERRMGATRLYRNTLRRGYAWVTSENTAGAARPVELLHRSPERIALRAVGPGRLVLAEVAYPGWRVTVDGAPQPLQTAKSLLRAVDLPPGEHTVVFFFRPLSVYLGLALWGVGVTFLLVAGWVRRRTPAAEAAAGAQP